jgi:hypothetical protein
MQRIGEHLSHLPILREISASSTGRCNASNCKPVASTSWGETGDAFEELRFGETNETVVRW